MERSCGRPRSSVIAVSTWTRSCQGASTKNSRSVEATSRMMSQRSLVRLDARCWGVPKRREWDFIAIRASGGCDPDGGAVRVTDEVDASCGLKRVAVGAHEQLGCGVVGEIVGFYAEGVDHVDDGVVDYDALWDVSSVGNPFVDKERCGCGVGLVVECGIDVEGWPVLAADARHHCEAADDDWLHGCELAQRCDEVLHRCSW